MYNSSQWIGIRELAHFLSCKEKQIKEIIATLDQKVKATIINKYQTGYKKNKDNEWEPVYQTTYDKFAFQDLIQNENNKI
jgi:hypothetical protein